MKNITLFLASSKELLEDREKFEREIARKKNLWTGKGVSLRLIIWEDLTARMSSTRSQDDYNTKIRESDLFVLLAASKVGMYTAEEFEVAFGSFKTTNKPFIFTYFRELAATSDTSLRDFKDRLHKLGHFHSTYSSFDNLWNQFNKELDRLLLVDSGENVFEAAGQRVSRTINQGEKSVYIEKTSGDITFNMG